MADLKPQHKGIQITVKRNRADLDVTKVQRTKMTTTVISSTEDNDLSLEMMTIGLEISVVMMKVRAAKSTNICEIARISDA
jgi:hypothetical protein